MKLLNLVKTENGGNMLFGKHPVLGTSHNEKKTLWRLMVRLKLNVFLNKRMILPQQDATDGEAIASTIILIKKE